MVVNWRASMARCDSLLLSLGCDGGAGGRRCRLAGEPAPEFRVLVWRPGSRLPYGLRRQARLEGTALTPTGHRLSTIGTRTSRLVVTASRSAPDYRMP